MACNPLLPLFIFVFKVSQIWPVGVLQADFCVLLTNSHHFEHFFMFWHKKIFQLILYFPCLRPGIVLFWFWNGGWYLATKNRTLDVLIVPGVSLLLSPLSRRSQEIYGRTHTFTYIFSHPCVCLCICLSILKAVSLPPIPVHRHKFILTITLSIFASSFSDSCKYEKALIFLSLFTSLLRMTVCNQHCQPPLGPGGQAPRVLQTLATASA